MRTSVASRCGFPRPWYLRCCSKFRRLRSDHRVQCRVHPRDHLDRPRSHSSGHRVLWVGRSSEGDLCSSGHCEFTLCARVCLFGVI